MSEIDIDRLRGLRARARSLSETLVSDLSPFLNREDKLSFVRLPTKEHKADDVGVTVTCSCLMSLAAGRSLKEFTRTMPGWDAEESFKRILSYPQWTSSSLPAMNAFTCTVVLRTFAFLKAEGVLDESHLNETHTENSEGPRKGEHSVRAIFEMFAGVADPVKALQVLDYPTSSTIVYWFLDAVDRGSIKVEGEFWLHLARWSTREYRRQQSLTISGNAALMDPVSMAMAACICARLRRLLSSRITADGIRNELPSAVELRHGIALLFQQQTRSGLWPKYFPLFHYPSAGANFCFTFEMLEAVLNEFGSCSELELTTTETVFTGLELAVEWCEKNRLEYRHGDHIYRGWNSGGEIASVMSEQPESWATAVVHMFLRNLQDVLTARIQEGLLIRYGATDSKSAVSLDQLLDIEIEIAGNRIGIKQLVKEQIISHAKGKDMSNLGHQPLDGRLSALLFGPPGTSKTEISRAIAKELGWPLLQIDPSHFLRNGLESIYVTADQIFADLLDLSGVIILFDEMDALVQTRDDPRARLDITSQFLTTSMLPKLAKLHNEARVIFLMATNFQERFDAAIKRAGRFDLLICMGPPTFEAKLDFLESRIRNETEKRAAKERTEAFSDRALKLLQSIRATSDAKNKRRFELLLFGEFQAFLKILRKPTLLQGLSELNEGSFFKQLDELGPTLLRIGDEEKYEASYERLPRDHSDLKDDWRSSQMLRYLIDRTQSRMQ